jgi:hypothetical protein
MHSTPAAAGSKPQRTPSSNPSGGYGGYGNPTPASRK